MKICEQKAVGRLAGDSDLADAIAGKPGSCSNGIPM
jgi:hypothetical protein